MVSFAVKQDARRSIVLINRSGVVNTVDLKFYGEKTPEEMLETARISEQGLGARLKMSPHSVSFFSYTL